MMLVKKFSIREFRSPIKAITSRDVDVIDGDIGRISKVNFLKIQINVRHKKVQIAVRCEMLQYPFL